MTTNTLTNLIPHLYANLDVVSRELVGMIPAVTINASTERGKVDQSVYVPTPGATTGGNIVPAMSIPAEADHVIPSAEVKITKSRYERFSWDGEEERGLNTGPGINGIRLGQFQQAIRSLCNQVEADLTALHATTSRAYGTAGSTPFNTAGDFTDATMALKILKDNGAPISDNQLVINTAAGARFLGKQAEAHRQGADSILRQGVFLTVAGMDIRESGQIVNFTAGSFTSGTLTSAVRAVGTTALVTSADYASGLGAGDIITLAHESDAHKYVVRSVVGTTITIAAPGLRTATAATGTVAITKVASSARNMAFNRSALILAARMPERPSAGDMAIDRTTLTDPRSGLSFEVSVYPGYRKVVYEVGLAWGVANIKPEHSAILLG